MGETNRKVMFLVLALLLVCIAIVQTRVDPDIRTMREEAASKTGGDSRSLMVQLPSQFLVASFTGFREVIASALWVRASTFFEQGKYGPIVPIIRLVTWLDPHNVDFYLTGAWHMDYNFVDKYQMSDKRYIPPAIALLKEGCLNNPKIWDIYFELAANHYARKANNPEKALEYMKLACEHDGADTNTGQPVPRPAFVDSMLAHAYEAVGKFDDAMKAYELGRSRAVRIAASIKSKDTYSWLTGVDVMDKNEMVMCYRLAYRNGRMDCYKKAVELAKRLSEKNSIPKWVYEDTNKDYLKRLASNNPPADAKKPVDTAFDVTWELISPKVIRLKGHINLIRWSEYQNLASEVLTRAYQENAKKSADKREIWRDGFKLRWMLSDLDYKMPDPNAYEWDIDPRSTIAWDTVSVEGGSFTKRIDLSSNPDMYPFLSKNNKYKLTVWAAPFSPNCPDFVGDRVGFNGEAFSDKLLSKTYVPGVNTIVKEFVIDAKDLGVGPLGRAIDSKS